MGNFKITHVGCGGATDITATITGMPQNLPEDEAIEMTNWDKWESFWNNYADLLERRERENGNNS